MIASMINKIATSPQTKLNLFLTHAHEVSTIDFGMVHALKNIEIFCWEDEVWHLCKTVRLDQQ